MCSRIRGEARNVEVTFPMSSGFSGSDVVGAVTLSKTVELF